MQLDDKVAITRQMLRDNLWILKDLVVASPTQIVHADSTLGCHTHSYFPVIKPTVDVFQSCIDTDFSEAHQEVRCGHCGVTCAQLEGTHAIPSCVKDMLECDTFIACNVTLKSSPFMLSIAMLGLFFKRPFHLRNLRKDTEGMEAHGEERSTD